MNKLGCTGLGVMGAPMCMNFTRKCGATVTAFDVRSEPLEKLTGSGVRAAAELAQAVTHAELNFFLLPGGKG